MAETLLLKKYPNRRLYDTEKSAYVTLSQVAEMIKQGRQVEVRDVETKEDVTAFILTQIVFEEAKKKTTLLPVSLLYLIIRFGETVLSEFLEKYLEQTFNNYLAYKVAADEQFKNWLQLGMNFSNMAQQTMDGLAPFKPWVDAFSAAAPPKGAEEPEG
ncbi:MAG: transcriptional regulator [Deltaproteobacteria bacterium]|nr:MAG: transcriptional regulator [Deltaproteobacteria bacterium]